MPPAIVMPAMTISAPPAARSTPNTTFRERLNSLLAGLQQPRRSIVQRCKRYVYRYPKRVASLFALFSLGLAAFSLATLISRSPPGETSIDTKKQAMFAQPPVTNDELSSLAVQESVDPFESRQFAETIEDMHNQLDALTESPPLSVSGIAQPTESDDLQSLYQRLERLQQSHVDESRSKWETN